MAAVLEPGACETNIGALASCCAVGFPFKYGKWSCTDLAFYTEKLAQVGTLKSKAAAFQLNEAMKSERELGVHTLSVVLFDHLYVWILWKTVLANGREVRRLPTGAVEILLDLRRHLG